MKTEDLLTKESRMKPVHPGEILREDVLPALGINISEAARHRVGPLRFPYIKEKEL